MAYYVGVFNGVAEPDALMEECRRVAGLLLERGPIALNYAIEAVLADMIAAKKGHVATISSVAAFVTGPGVGPYCASKWAIEGLTRSLAQELPAGLAAIPLSPGVVDTEMLRRCQPVLAEQTAAPAEWARSAAGFILGLGEADSGQSISVP